MTLECLDDNVASEFVSGALPDTSITRVESHLASCRDCRMLVAALAGDHGDDSNAKTRKHERESHSQVGPTPTKTYTIGDRVGRYLVLSTLGAGGMGVVFAAYDPQLDRKVALKLLRGNLGVTTKEARTRLRREAQAIAQLNHPNVVGVYDVGTTDDGDLYIAMEFVEGQTLTSWLKAYPRTWREIIDVFRQAARGLFAAHSVGLLHRDFKPDNVLVGEGDGRVRVTDFGLARSVFAVDEPSKAVGTVTALNVELTATGTVLGTPRYMPPEQLLGPAIDARSDQFSFCVALYEALYGVHPLPGGTAVSMLEKGERPLPPPEATSVPVWVHKIVARGLERDRTKRYPSMAELIAELSPAPVRSRARLAVALGAAIVLVAGVTGAGIRWRAPVDTTEVVNKDLKWAMEQLEKVERELRVVKQQRDQLEEQLEKNAQTAVETEAQLKHELKEKEDKIIALGKNIEELKRAIQPALPATAPSEPITRALYAQSHDIDGCFVEWADRQAGDTRIVVTLIITDDGVAHRAAARFPDLASTDKEQVGVLPTCVAPAIEHVRFPNLSSGDVDATVTITWVEKTLGFATQISPHQAATGALNL